MRRKMLFIDVETGGRDADDHAICSLGAVVVNQGFIDEEKYWVINDPEGFVEDQAREVHKLTDEELRAGTRPVQVVEDLEQLFLRHDMRLPRKVLLGGHGLDLDVRFMKRLYRLACAEYDVRFERRTIDTMAVAWCLEQAGRIEIQGPASLVNTSKALGVPFKREGAHNALEDVKATVKCWQKELHMMRHPQ